MLTILAEKPDVGNKIAAALDQITLSGGKTVTFAQLKANEKAVKAQQSADGFLKIRFLGQDCYVTWGFGHLGQLMDAKDYNPAYQNWRSMPHPFIPQPYRIKLRTTGSSFDARTKKQFGVIKKLFQKSDGIINATDFDREGEVIFSYIYELCGCRKPVKRVCFASQTQDGIQDAFAHLKSWAEVKNIEAAGRMRGIADWVVGINLTVAMTLHENVKGEVLSIGRVQTPTLKILADRELAIRNFVPVPYWTLDAVFTTSKGESYPATHEKKRFSDKAEAERIFQRINGKDGIITALSEKREERKPPQLYSLSALQMDANAKYGMTLKQTLDAAQALYDGGYTTYPRTDSRYLTEDMVPTVNRVLDSLAKDASYAPLIDGKARSFAKYRYFDDKKVESHFAIIPTVSRPKSLPAPQAKVYDLICRSVICMLYGNAVLKRTNVTTTVEGEPFTSAGVTLLDPGYMAVTGLDKETALPALAKGEVVSGQYEGKEKQTEPPKRFTDKTLLSAMIGAGKELEDEELKAILADPSVAGIGTPATRDAIIETLLLRGYAVRAKKALSATDKGIALIQSLPVEAVKSPALTAKWEKRLHEIERGNEDPEAFRRDIERTVTAWYKEIDAAPRLAGSVWSAPAAPPSPAKHTTRTKSASTSPRRTRAKAAPDESINREPLPWEADNAPEAAPAEANAPAKAETVLAPCPVCGKAMRAFDWGYGCTGYKDGCKFTVGTICHKKLTPNQFNALVQKRDTGLLSGFKSKAGKPFKAHLVLKEDNSIGFVFENKKESGK
ncbi:MAG: topoisomerase C-terminal repeat-containing protein [Clostridia bacterium]|nr:topoisomerase C-terminal repeat-containing protein [Clostridia bacterium]